MSGILRCCHASTSRTLARGLVNTVILATGIERLRLNGTELQCLARTCCDLL